jgi:hypothetical protein
MTTWLRSAKEFPCPGRSRKEPVAHCCLDFRGEEQMKDKVTRRDFLNGTRRGRRLPGVVGRGLRSGSRSGDASPPILGAPSVGLK